MSKSLTLTIYDDLIDEQNEWYILRSINIESLKEYLQERNIYNLKFIDSYITQSFYRKIQRYDIILTAGGKKYPNGHYPKWFSSLEEAVDSYLETFLDYIDSLKLKKDSVLLWIKEPEKSYNPETKKYNIYSRFIIMNKAECKEEFLTQINQLFDC
ncbi:MAG: hypothetical protein ULS35scaffold63_23 [Phage 33_17]|nr:MAG: hypothetical protein ULS35scaffold63_23 [Phage 33_17]